MTVFGFVFIMAPFWFYRLFVFGIIMWKKSSCQDAGIWRGFYLIQPFCMVRIYSGNKYKKKVTTTCCFM
jgi:hypothetical protein